VVHTGAHNAWDCAGGQAVCRALGKVFKPDWIPAAKSVQQRGNALTLEFKPRLGLSTQTGSLETQRDHGAGTRLVVANTAALCSAATGVKPSFVAKCA
jgi:hypothetical protein